MATLDFVAKLSSFQKLNRDIDGVLRLKNSIQLHEVLLVEPSHDFYLVYQGLFPFVFTKSSLFGKRFHCVLLTVLVSND